MVASSVQCVALNELRNMVQSGRFHPLLGLIGAGLIVITTVGAIAKYDEAARCPILAGLCIMWLIFSFFLISGIKKQNLQYLRACRLLLMAFEWISSTFVMAVLVQIVINRENHNIGLKFLLPVAFTVMLSFGGIFALCLLIVNEVIRYIEDLHKARQQKPWLEEQSLISKHLLVTSDEDARFIKQH